MLYLDENNLFQEYISRFPLASRVLSNEILNNKLSHAYLFYGNDLDSIFNFSCLFAKIILCKSKTGDDNCNSCKLFTGSNFVKPKLDKDNIKYYMNNHVDFIVWEAQDKKKFITIEQVRDIISENNKHPILSDKKVLFLNDISKLKLEGANALLKTLEEANHFIIIILTVNSLDNVLNTILSRCQIISLNNNSINQSNIKIDFDKYLTDSYSKIYDLINEITLLTREEQIELLKNIQIAIWKKEIGNNFLNINNVINIIEKIDFYIKCLDNSVSSRNIIENFLTDLYKARISRY